jgi:hypothetical protein
VRKGYLVGIVAAAASAAVVGVAAPAVASVAPRRPCGPGVSTSGVGSLGSHWTLKSKHDDDGPNGSQVIGEEFEIAAKAGAVWHVTFADNGIVFFDGDSVATADGVREQHAAPNQAGTQHMTVHATSRGTGEVIDGFVDVPPAPNCGH